MKKYILVYKGGSPPTSAEDRAALMQAWRGWVGGLGQAAIDPGNPFGPSMAGAPAGAVSAELAKGCPHLTTYGTAIAGAVEIYEALPID